MRMLSVTVFLLIIFPPWLPGAGEDLESQQLLGRRRREYLTWVIEEFGRRETEMQPLDGRLWSLNQARLSLNRETELASSYFETVRLTADPDFMGIRLLKTLLDFGDSGRLSHEAVNHLRQIIRDWPMDRVQSISRVATWPPTFTENHDLMHLTIGLFSEQLRGEDLQPQIRELKKSLAWRYERGFYEWGSHRYQLHYSNPLLILAEYAPDPVLRHGAEDLFNLILAERALMSVGGYLGGPGMRSYGRNRGCDYLDNNRYDSFLPTVWLGLGVGEPRFDFTHSESLEPAGEGYGNGKDPRLNQDEAMFLATSDVAPHPIVHELLAEVAEEPELIYIGRRASAGHPFQNALPSDRRSHQILSYYNTPHVSMGSLQYLPSAGKMSVSFNSQPRFFSVMFPENPAQVLRTRLSDQDLSAGNNNYDYKADHVVQHRNWLIAAGELSTSHGLSSRRIGPWDLFRVGRGLCAHFELPEGWHVFQISDLDQYPDEESFVAALNVPEIKEGKVYGTATNGDRITVDLAEMSIEINGSLRNPPVEMLHNSRFMKSVFGSGEIAITTRRSSHTFSNKDLQSESVDE